MVQDVDGRKSYWWSLLSEFGEELLLKKRLLLNLSQVNMARRCGMAQSEISRIERGLVTPQNVPTFDATCEEYKLKQEDRDKYAKLISGTKNPEDSDSSKGILRLLKDQIAFVANLNRSGNPKMAIKQAEIIRAWLNNNARQALIAKNRKIINQFTLLLLEESAAWWDVAESKDELLMETKPLLRKSYSLDQEGSFYLTNEAFHCYILGNNKKVLEIFPKIKDIKTNDGHNWGIELLRIKTIVVAEEKDLEMFQDSEKQILRILTNSSVDQTNKAYLLEGLGKAYSFVDKEKAILILWESLEWIKNIDLALKICNECGFMRHKRQILDLK